MQSNLNCADSTCAFNKSGNCYASHIKIEGFDAYITPETYCDSFRDAHSFNLSSFDDHSSLTGTQNISCSAINCKYNFSGGCGASHVQINLENDSCETFQAK